MTGSTSSTDTTEAQREALEILSRGQRFVLSGHVRPDGDVVGSEAALARVLLGMGKEVVILNPDPAEERYGYLVESAPFQTHTGGPVPEHDVCVLLDINELGRCGSLAEPLAASGSKKVVIDHHVFHGTPWWDAAFVDVRASATGLLVWRVAGLLEQEIDREAATAIFTSIVTDTGWFKYSNTDAETLTVCADLVGRGVEPDRIFDAVFQRAAPTEPRAIAGLLESLRYEGNGRIALVELSMQRSRELGFKDGDPVLDILRSVAGVEVVIFLREMEPEIWKLSARSKTHYDVYALAAEFGGGGHVKAAGATIPGGREDVLATVISRAIARLESVEVKSNP